MRSILGNSRKKDLTFTKEGLISINANAAKVLSLQEGDVIDLMDNRERGYGELYLYVRHRAPVFGHHKAKVFSSNNGYNHYRAQSIDLCRFILSEFGVSQRIDFCVGEPIQLDVYGTAVPIMKIKGF